MDSVWLRRDPNFKSLSETRRHVNSIQHLNLSAKHWNQKLRATRCLRRTSFIDRKMLDSLLNCLNVLPFCFAREVVVPCCRYKSRRLHRCFHTVDTIIPRKRIDARLSLAFLCEPEAQLSLILTCAATAVVILPSP